MGLHALTLVARSYALLPHINADRIAAQ